MKRLIIIVLVFALLLSAAAFAEQDPIVGTWYVYISVKDSIMSSDFPDCDSAIMLITFSETGSVYYLELEYDGSKLTDNGLATIGKWEKTGTSYELSIISVGISTAEIRDGILHAAIFNTETYMKYRKLEEFNFYTEVYRK